MRPLRLRHHGDYFRQHWRRLLVSGLSTGVLLLVVAQLAYPKDSLPPLATIDGVGVGRLSRDEAIKLLDDTYKDISIDLYFGDNETSYRHPKPSDIGLEIHSKPMVDAQVYPLWLRMVPTSLWWAQNVLPKSSPEYVRDDKKLEEYVGKELGKSCDVTPKNASLRFEDGTLHVIPALDGGSCKLEDVTTMLRTTEPTLRHAAVRFAMDERLAKIHDSEAADFADEIMDRTKDMSIKVGDDDIAVSQNTVLSWIDFSAPDSGLVAKVNTKRASDFLSKTVAPKVTILAGTTRVTTVDFTETKREHGQSGQALDTKGTIDLITKWLNGEDVELVAKVAPTSPLLTYSRSYTATDTGLAALIKNFAESHSGVYGVSYAELDGEHRHAGYNETKVFETASTYKLYVAYGTLKRIESKTWHWTDKNISGSRDLAKCFDDMIVLSDNECAKALLSKIGYAQLTHEIQDAGFTSSSFLNSYIQSTPGDLVKYLGLLGSGQLLNTSSTNTLIAAMKRNVYRQGIPSGTSGTVADKVGFLYPGHVSGVAGVVNLLHDASIVYGKTGTYALVVMTGNSSWGTIAELTRQIESWRNS